jgi:hypothetical protein
MYRKPACNVAHLGQALAQMSLQLVVVRVRADGAQLARLPAAQRARDAAKPSFIALCDAVGTAISPHIRDLAFAPHVNAEGGPCIAGHVSERSYAAALVVIQKLKVQQDAVPIAEPL